MIAQCLCGSDKTPYIVSYANGVLEESICPECAPPDLGRDQVHPPITDPSSFILAPTSVGHPSEAPDIGIGFPMVGPMLFSPERIIRFPKWLIVPDEWIDDRFR